MAAIQRAGGDPDATGDVSSPRIRQFIRRTARPVLEKPLEMSSLAAMVGKVTGTAA